MPQTPSQACSRACLVGRRKEAGVRPEDGNSHFRCCNDVLKTFNIGKLCKVALLSYGKLRYAAKVQIFTLIVLADALNSDLFDPYHCFNTEWIDLSAYFFFIFVLLARHVFLYLKNQCCSSSNTSQMAKLVVSRITIVNAKTNAVRLVKSASHYPRPRLRDPRLLHPTLRLPFVWNFHRIFRIRTLC